MSLIGPRFLVYAALEMHPLDRADRLSDLKERVVDRFYDPVRRLFRVFG